MKRKILLLAVILLIKAVILSGSELAKTTKNIWKLIVDWGYLENYHPLLIDGYENSDSLFCIYADQIIKMNCDYSQKIITEYLNNQASKIIVTNRNAHFTPFVWTTQNRNYYPTILSDTSMLKRRVLYNPSSYQLIFKKSLDKTTFFPSKSNRLLGISKIWNNYKYYYPYQDLLPNEKAFESILLKYIKKVLTCRNEREYHLIILEFTSEFRDSHSYALSIPLLNQFGAKIPPFKTRYIHGRVIITGYYSQLLFNKTGLKQGDIILKINDNSVNKKFTQIKPYTSYSNNGTLNRDLCYNAFKTGKDSMRLEIDRDGKSMHLIVPTYTTSDLDSIESEENKENYISKINDSVILIKCQYVDTLGLRKVLTEDKLLRWFIFDLRASTEWIKPIAEDFFFNTETAFCCYFGPLFSRPGYFSNPRSITIGPGKPDLFINGAHVILLVNEETQSQGEFQTMFLQAIPNSVTIGSRTAGADGNVTKFAIPGYISISMTGLGIQYPNGTKTQKNGVKIDFFISPNLKCAKKGIDEDLDFAIKLIEKTRGFSDRSK